MNSKEYQHRYYLAHRGANVKHPHPNRTHPVQFTPEQIEERKRRRMAQIAAWRKSHAERYYEMKRLYQNRRYATDPAWRAKQLAHSREWYRRRMERDPDYAEMRRIKHREYYKRIRADPVRWAEFKRKHNEYMKLRRKKQHARAHA